MARKHACRSSQEIALILSTMADVKDIESINSLPKRLMLNFSERNFVLHGAFALGEGFPRAFFFKAEHSLGVLGFEMGTIHSGRAC
jgi:hypothetical protein